MSKWYQPILSIRTEINFLANLTTLSPLGPTTPHENTIGAFTISEVANLAMASITARKGASTAVKTILTKILKQPAPEVGGFCSGDIEAFWIGQSQWMLVAPFCDYEDIVASFAATFKGKASLTEQTDGWCRFAINGPNLERLCSLLCAIDMRGFIAGKSARTTIEHIGCFVLRYADDQIHIIGPRSSAGSLHHVICAAAKSAPF